MKTKITILVIVGIFLASCGAQTATQIVEVATEVPATEASTEPAAATLEAVATPESVVVVIEEPIATESPTEVPTESPLACLTLLEPINGSGLPVTGKVTFSWTSMDEAESYVLNFLLPSGYTASFETDQTIHDRYMEAFASGGEYQWQVIARGADGSDICVSEFFTFDKPAYEKYEKPKGDHNDGENGGTGDEWTPPPFPTSEPD